MGGQETNSISTTPDGKVYDYGGPLPDTISLCLDKSTASWTIKEDFEALGLSNLPGTTISYPEKDPDEPLPMLQVVRRPKEEGAREVFNRFYGASEIGF